MPELQELLEEYPGFFKRLLPEYLPQEVEAIYMTVSDKPRGYDWRCLAVTRGVLIGVESSYEEGELIRAVSTHALPLSSITALSSSSDFHTSSMDKGVHKYEVTIDLDRPLGTWGTQITLPANPGDDYIGTPEKAERAAREMTDAVLSGWQPTP
jgi:hypothetical protein